MKSILVVFVFQLLLLVHPHLGRKHYLVEVADNPPPTGNGALSENGNDYGIGEHERCEGLRKLCDNRPTCLEAIKCGAGETASHVSGDEDEEYQEVGHKAQQHREYKPAHFEHAKKH